MSRADYLELGDWNVSCYQCGRKRKASMMEKHWQGYYVCPEHNEPRQPQDFVRATPDVQTPPWAQPRAYAYAKNIIDIPWTPEGTDVGIIEIPIPTTDTTAVDPSTPEEPPEGDPEKPIIINIPSGTTIRGIRFVGRAIGSGLIINNDGTALPPRRNYPPTEGPPDHPTKLIPPDPPQIPIPIQWNGGPYPPPELVFSVQPTDTQVNGFVFPAIHVAAIGNLGLVVEDYTADVTLSIENNAGDPIAGELSGTLTKPGGVDFGPIGLISYADISIDQPGNGYTLRATDGVSTAISEPFNILNTIYALIEGPLIAPDATDYITDQNPGVDFEQTAYSIIVTTSGDISALSTGQNYHPDTVLTIINTGLIAGPGGDGGGALGTSSPTDGGTALYINQAIQVKINNALGQICGGGGGGGLPGRVTTAQSVEASDHNPLKTRAGHAQTFGGAGGGAGYPGGAAGAAGSTVVSLTGWNIGSPTEGVNLLGTLGTIDSTYTLELDPTVTETNVSVGDTPEVGTTVGGAGCTGGVAVGTVAATGGNGGRGGNYATAGTAGTDASYSGTPSELVLGGAGGAGGNAIEYVAGATITYIATGTIIGAVVEI